ncbi:hypothetical protein VCJ_000506 [Vibrio metoecus]|nr:hypothetical protein VCJ_000506 [Vibrio metoecus]
MCRNIDAMNDIAQIVDQSFINIMKQKKKGKQKPMVNKK